MRADTARPAGRYGVWYTIPGGDRSVLLGWTRRLDKHLTHRASPVTGEWPVKFTGWVNAVGWLLDTYHGHERTSEFGHASETEQVS